LLLEATIRMTLVRMMNTMKKKKKRRTSTRKPTGEQQDHFVGI
jgi:hypothetical protein